MSDFQRSVSFPVRLSEQLYSENSNFDWPGFKGSWQLYRIAEKIGISFSQFYQMEKQPKYGLFLYLWATILFIKLATVAVLIHYKSGYSFELRTMIETTLTFIVGVLILVRAFLHDRYIRLLSKEHVLNFFQFINQNSPKKIAILCIYLITKPYLKKQLGHRIRILRHNIHILTVGIYVLIIGVLILAL